MRGKRLGRRGDPEIEIRVQLRLSARERLAGVNGPEFLARIGLEGRLKLLDVAVEGLEFVEVKQAAKTGAVHVLGRIAVRVDALGTHQWEREGNRAGRNAK